MSNDVKSNAAPANGEPSQDAPAAEAAEAASAETASAPWPAIFAAAPILTVVVIFMTRSAFYGIFDLSGPTMRLTGLGWQPAASSPAIVAGDFLSRHTLHVSASILTLFWLTTFAGAIHVVLRALGERRPRQYGAAALLVLTTAAVVFLTQREDGMDLILIQLPRELRAELLDHVFAPATALGEGAEMVKERLVATEKLLGGLVISALACLTFSACALLWAGCCRDEEALRRRYRMLELLLYCGTAMLIAGILHVHQILRWPGAFLGEGEAEVVRTLANGFTATTGLYWSLLLLGFYLPTILLLRRAAAQLARRKKKTLAEQRQWIEAEKLAPSPRERLSHLAAVLGPLIAGGPLAALAQLLSG